MEIESLSFGELRIEGVSRAGEETWIRVHPPGLVFDVGRGAVKLAGAHDFFLSHGHLDHILGLPYVLSLRTLHNSRSTRVFAPAALVGGLKKLIQAAESLADERYDYEIHPLEAADQVRVAKDMQVEAFATHHVIPSLGFHLRRERKRLRPEFKERPGAELAALKARGVEIELLEENVWLSYCGDTGPEVFTMDPRVFDSQVLMIECTFFDEASRERARRFGHMHIDDLTERAGDFRNRDLVIHHTSRRYSCDQIREVIAARLDLTGINVHLFGC